MKTQAYLYKWTQYSTSKWYIGCRTAKNCHPNDGYICSSSIVKPLIKSNSEDWIRQILCIGDSNYIRQLESDYLHILDAKNDPQSYNKHNSDGKFTSTDPETGKKISLANKGRIAWNKNCLWSDDIKEKMKKPKHTEESRKKLSEIRKGKKRNLTPEQREKMRLRMSGENNPMFGKTHSEEIRKKISDLNKGKPSTFKGKKHSEESKQKMSDACKGKKHSEESKQKMSESQKKRWAKNEN
jgi:hypothetical protein